MMKDEMNRSTAERGAVSIRAAAAVVAAVLVAAMLLWPESDRPATSGDGTADPAVHAADATELYTCGMHPDVIAEEPGTCPICSMKLTPMNIDAAPPTGERVVKYWRAPMDPSYVSDKPGKSPMGMDLVPVYEDEAGTHAADAVTISPVVVQNMGVRTALVRTRPLVRSIRSLGTVDYAEPLVKDVTTKFEGWIEGLHADYTGQPVEAGTPLFSVYSRELYSSQEEYVLSLRNRNAIGAENFPEAARDMERLVESSRMRLELFDISDAQIDEIEKRGEPSRTLTILSPHSGVVVEKMVRDGMRITPGMKLYTIADLSRVWVYVDIYENEVPFVKIGQQASMELSYLPGDVFHGKVVYVYPFVATETRTVKVRMEFDNPHLLLKPGMFANVHIEADLGRSGLVVPRAAVIDTGERRIAFVDVGEGRFEPREVRLGVDLGNDTVEILAGLAENEPVVTSGQFLLDSESKLREAVQKMMERRTGSSGGEATATGSGTVAPRRASATATAAAAAGAGGERETLPVGAARALAPATLPVVDAYLALHATLADGDGDAAEAAAMTLLAPLGVLDEAASSSTVEAAVLVKTRAVAAKETVHRMEGRSLDAIRARFGDLSDNVIEIVRLAGMDDAGSDLHVLRCPMAGGSWLQRGTEARNPYYGFAMLRCGDPVAKQGAER